MAAAVSEIGLIDRVQKDAIPQPVFPLNIGALVEDEPPPVARVRACQIQGVAIAPHGIIEERRENHVVAGRAQHLQRSARTVDTGQRVAHVNGRAVQLDHRAGVNHDRHPLGNDEGCSVGERITLGIETDEVREVVGEGQRVAIGPAVADDANDRARSCRRQSTADVAVRIGQRAVLREIVGVQLVDEDCVSAGGGDVTRSTLEPEIEGRAGAVNAIARKCDAASVIERGRGRRIGSEVQF